MLTSTMARYLCAVFLYLLTSYALSEVYQWTDKNGRTHFGDRPPEKVNSENISEKLTIARSICCAPLPNIPPLVSFGDLTTSIGHDSCRSSIGSVTRDYITEWYQMYLTGEHTSSPALTSLYGWFPFCLWRRFGGRRYNASVSWCPAFNVAGIITLFINYSPGWIFNLLSNE